MYTLIPDLESTPTRLLFTICILEENINSYTQVFSILPWTTIVGDVYIMPDGNRRFPYLITVHNRSITVQTMKEVHNAIYILNSASNIN